MKRMHDKKQLACEVTEEEFEELVRATPTLVRLVENEGDLQLQTEHDTTVLDIDTDFTRVFLTYFSKMMTGVDTPYLVRGSIEGVGNCTTPNVTIEKIIISGMFASYENWWEDPVNLVDIVQEQFSTASAVMSIEYTYNNVKYIATQNLYINSDSTMNFLLNDFTLTVTMTEISTASLYGIFDKQGWEY